MALPAILVAVVGCGSNILHGDAGEGEDVIDDDAAECTPLPGDECNALQHCGCSEGETCGFYILSPDAGLTCRYGAMCLDRRVMILSLWEECAFPPNFGGGVGVYCGNGLVCLPDEDRGISHCVPLCEDDSECRYECVPGPEGIPVPDGYPHCSEGSTVDLEYNICSS